MTYAPMLPERTPPRLRLRAARISVPAVLAAALVSGCASVDREAAVGSLPIDVRDRHPIVLTQTDKVLDVFAGINGGRLDERQADDVKAFGHHYRSEGRGPLIVAVPAGSPNEGPSVKALPAIRRALAEAGIDARAVKLASYQEPAPTDVAPVKLVYKALGAQVASQCGLWPDDAANAGVGWRGLENRPDHNFGCAYQQFVAAQVADPVDLVRGRQETPPDAARRTDAYDKYRKGENPSSQYDKEKLKVEGE